MSRVNIKQIQGLTPSSILFIGDDYSLSESNSNLKYDYDNNILETSGLRVTGASLTASTGKYAVLDDNGNILYSNENPQGPQGPIGLQSNSIYVYYETNSFATSTVIEDGFSFLDASSNVINSSNISDYSNIDSVVFNFINFNSIYGLISPNNYPYITFSLTNVSPGGDGVAIVNFKITSSGTPISINGNILIGFDVYDVSVLSSTNNTMTQGSPYILNITNSGVPGPVGADGADGAVGPEGPQGVQGVAGGALNCIGYLVTNSTLPTSFGDIIFTIPYTTTLTDDISNVGKGSKIYIHKTNADNETFIYNSNFGGQISFERADGTGTIAKFNFLNTTLIGQYYSISVSGVVSAGIPHTSRTDGLCMVNWSPYLAPTANMPAGSDDYTSVEGVTASSDYYLSDSNTDTTNNPVDGEMRLSRTFNNVNVGEVIEIMIPITSTKVETPKEDVIQTLASQTNGLATSILRVNGAGYQLSLYIKKEVFVSSQFITLEALVKEKVGTQDENLNVEFTESISGFDGQQGIKGPQGPRANNNLDWITKNSNYTLNVGEAVFADTSGGTFSLTLPASPSIGDMVAISDKEATFGTNNLTVSGNGSKIQGFSDDILLDMDEVSFNLVYSGPTLGWKLDTYLMGFAGEGATSASRPGADGADGVQGAQGPQGLAGTIGVDGVQGPQGLAGTIGVDGVQGPQGLAGTIGVDGAQGPQGLAGIIGVDGVQGPQGLAGTIGVDGVQGPQGLAGTIGVDGVQGPQGLKGNDGTSVSILGTYDSEADLCLGLSASSSSIGEGYIIEGDLWVYDGTSNTCGFVNVGQIQGPQGIAGTIGVDGVQGPQGLAGIIGVDGTQGPQGPSSNTSLNWISKDSNYSINVGEAILADTSGGSFTLTLPSSPTEGDMVGISDKEGTFSINNLTIARNGSKIQGLDEDLVLNIDLVSFNLLYSGPTIGWKLDTYLIPLYDSSLDGAQGPQGIAGTIGIDGVQGPQGLAGTIGVDGVQGPQGLAGTIGVDGVQGPQGIAGTIGIDGVQGPQGLAGTIGVDGVQGPQGLAGTIGIDGAQGPQGSGFNAIATPQDNRILTSDGTTTGANAEANLTWDEQTLTVTGASAGGLVLDIQGTSGQLFSVTDDLTGDLFSVKDGSGTTILNVNANDLVEVFGIFRNLTISQTSMTTNTIVYTLSSSLYTGAFIDYVATESSTGARRAGSLIITWDSTNVEFTEFATNDLVQATSDLSFSVDISGSVVNINALISSGSWNLNGSVRVI